MIKAINLFFEVSPLFGGFQDNSPNILASFQAHVGKGSRVFLFKQTKNIHPQHLSSVLIKTPTTSSPTPLPYTFMY